MPTEKEFCFLRVGRLLTVLSVTAGTLGASNGFEMWLWLIYTLLRRLTVLFSTRYSRSRAYSHRLHAHGLSSQASVIFRTTDWSRPGLASSLGTLYFYWICLEVRVPRGNIIIRYRIHCSLEPRLLEALRHGYRIFIFLTGVILVELSSSLCSRAATRSHLKHTALPDLQVLYLINDTGVFLINQHEPTAYLDYLVFISLAFHRSGRNFPNSLQSSARFTCLR